MRDSTLDWARKMNILGDFLEAIQDGRGNNKAEKLFAICYLQCISPYLQYPHTCTVLAKKISRKTRIT